MIASIGTTSFDGAQEGAFKGALESTFEWLLDRSLDPTAALRLTDTLFIALAILGSPSSTWSACAGWRASGARRRCASCSPASPTR